ncbi:MAG: DHH family phosphoesterase, partial [Clostridia bacterium]|nr:DHH family phosphoesterase [Clostridia bacterium]
NVIIMGHKYADFDAFGSCVGIARLCMFCGVPVNIVTDFDDSNLDRCRRWITRENDYNGVFIDGDSAMDLLNSDTLLIIADVNNRYQFESPALADNAGRICIIDHHRKTADYENPPLITYIEPSASAASELVSEMLEQILPPDELLSVEANLMMAGILLDTNQFAKNTGTRTFSAALYLRGAGADVGEVQELFKTELHDFQRELKFHSNVEIYRNVTAIAIAQGDCTFKDKIPAAKAADKLLTVEGVKASFAIVPIGSEVHISARSSGTINVQLLLEKLKGGGHFDSAGTRLEGVSVFEAVEMLKRTIDDYLKENTITKDDK